MTDSAQSSTRNNRRSFQNLLLSPSNQIRTGVWLFVHGFLITCIFFAMFMVTCSSMMTSLLSLSSQSPEAIAIVDSAKVTMYETFFLFVVASFLSSIFLAVRLTHRYLGPMQNTKRFVRALIEGNPKSLIQLRTGDDFPLADDLNELGKKLYPNL